MWTGKRPKIANTVLKMNKVGGLTLWDFMIYCKATETKMVWYMMKKQTSRSMKQNSPETDSHKYSQLIFEKGAETFQ